MQVGGSHRRGLETVERGAVLVDPPAPPLTAPVRNRYFYGKLLDVHHLELEQRYFLEHRRRLNRLTVGFGVVCGLDVTVASDGKGIVVSPGFAIDGLGREILVTEPICLADPSQLTDGCGQPAGTAQEKAVTLCLAYHECESEPTPVLVSDCDVREGCAAGAIRERYALLAHDGVPKTPPYGDIFSVCHDLAERLAELESPGSWVKAVGEKKVAGLAAERRTYASLLGDPRRGIGIGSLMGSRGGATVAGETGCDPPAEACVVLAVVVLATAETDAVVPQHAYRRTVLSNDKLYEAVLCLAAAVERCCGKKDTTETIEVVDGDGQSGYPGAKLEKPVVVRVTAAGKPAKNVAVEFADTTNAGGSFEPARAKTDASGQASAVWTLGSSGGAQTGRASVSSSVYVDLTANAMRG